MEIQENTNTTPGVDPVPAVNPAPVAPATPVQNDIARIEAAITDLVGQGETLFADEIAALKQKRDALIAKAEAEAKAAEGDIETAEQKFIAEYGTATAHGVEIVLLLGIIGKLFGVI